MTCLEGGAVAKNERKVAYMVILMVATFLLSWSPYAGLAMLVAFKPDVKINPLVGTVPVYLAKSSTVYNPIIYIYLNKQVNVLQRQNLGSSFRSSVAWNVLAPSRGLFRDCSTGGAKQLSLNL